TLDFAVKLAKRGKRVWLRYVLVPGITDGPAHPVSYTDRVRPLSESDPAFIYQHAETWATLTQSEALDRAATLRADNEIDYESTTFTLSSTGLPAIHEFLASATAGALSVLPSGDLPADLEDGEVTHWFTVEGDPVDEAGEDIRIVPGS
ncbi:hypothetical protein ACWELQ_35915, partial [Nocardia sp. NPDC004722]